MVYTAVWDETTPAGSAVISQGDDRIRELKVQLRERLEEFLISDMDADPVVVKAGTTLFRSFPATTAMVFFQAAAPTGWTQVVTHNDKALRVVSTAGGGSGGTKSFSAYVLETAELAAHTHTIPGQGWTEAVPVATHFREGSNDISSYTVNTGSTGNATALSPYYIDVIVCTKD